MKRIQCNPDLKAKWLKGCLVVSIALLLSSVSANNSANNNADNSAHKIAKKSTPTNVKKKSVRSDIPSSPEKITPLLVGSQIPDVSVVETDGSVKNLRTLTVNKPSIFIFYRGGWCPYCNRQLSQIRKIEDDLIDLGYKVIAISPDRPNILKKGEQFGKVKYHLVSDSSAQVAKAFGIAFVLDPRTVKRYKSYQLDIEEASGMGHHILPVPAVFIADEEGIIQFSYVNPNYKVRLDPNLLLQAAKSSLQVRPLTK